MGQLHYRFIERQCKSKAWKMSTQTWLQQPYRETGRTSSITATRHSCSGSYQKWVEQEDKQLIITDLEAVLSKSKLPDLASLAPCSLEEADSRMLTVTSDKNCSIRYIYISTHIGVDYGYVC